MDDKVGNTIGHTAGRRRMDLKAAAVELGITSEAIRRRAKRGTLLSEKGEDGLLYVWVPAVSDGVHDGPDGGSHGVSDSGSHGVSDGGSHADDQDNNTHPGLPEALLERFEDENGFLRQELERLHRELERKDAILLTMAQRIPELEAAPEPRESSQTASEYPGSGTTVRPDDRGSEKSSWFKRFFGLE